MGHGNWLADPPKSAGDCRVRMILAIKRRNSALTSNSHIAFDWRYGLGKATEIKAYIGYTGKDSIKNKEIVQFRKGIKIATTVGWLSSRDNKVNDVSFILLETPFTDVTPYKYSPTPKTGSLTIGVVGYPADKKKDDTQESGAEMWEEFKLTNYDLTTSETKMLDYQISTFGGEVFPTRVLKGTC